MNPYDDLFARYVPDLRAALAAAQAWWDALVAAEVEARRAAGEAGDEVAPALEARWPFGPTSHPWVLAVYNRYFRAVEELNERVRAAPPAAAPEGEAAWADEEESDAIFHPSAPIAPTSLLVDALHDRHDDLVEALTWLVYQPVGFDADERVI